MFGSSTYSLRTRARTSLYTDNWRYAPSFEDARTLTKPPTSVNNRMASELARIGALNISRIDFYLLRRDRHFPSTSSHYRCLMPASEAKVIEKSNRQYLSG